VPSLRYFQKTSSQRLTAIRQEGPRFLLLPDQRIHVYEEDGEGAICYAQDFNTFLVTNSRMSPEQVDSYAHSHPGFFRTIAVQEIVATVADAVRSASDAYTCRWPLLGATRIAHWVPGSARLDAVSTVLREPDRQATDELLGPWHAPRPYRVLGVRVPLHPTNAAVIGVQHGVGEAHYLALLPDGHPALRFPTSCPSCQQESSLFRTLDLDVCAPYLVCSSCAWSALVAFEETEPYPEDPFRWIHVD
jgi:hypothetical protein